MNPLFTGKIKKAATTAPKFVPRLPLCLLKQLFFAYIAPVLYELRGLYVCIDSCKLPARPAFYHISVRSDLILEAGSLLIIVSRHTAVCCNSQFFRSIRFFRILRLKNDLLNIHNLPLSEWDQLSIIPQRYPIIA